MPTTKRLPFYIAGGAAVSALAVTGGILASQSGSSSAAYSPAGNTAAANVITTRGTGLGQILVDGAGRTIYLFAKDTGPAATCTSSCLSYWPAVPATAGEHVAGQASAADLGSIAETGGGRQSSYAGHPLYYFVGDKHAGDTNGQALDQFGAKWYVLDPAGAAITQTGKANNSNGGGY
jgi:predicted lipoprotein with Yx(FWY)xxD motif